MELFPIIKLAITCFSVLILGVIIASYVLYKAKNLKKKKISALKPKPLPQKLAQKQTVNISASPVKEKIIEQTSQMQQRKRTLVKLPKVRLRPREERFQVVNKQQVELRNLAVLEEVKPFYLPSSPENNRQSISRKSTNVLDNYSSGGEKLHKLQLSPNFN